MAIEAGSLNYYGADAVGNRSSELSSGPMCYILVSEPFACLLVAHSYQSVTVLQTDLNYHEAYLCLITDCSYYDLSFGFYS